MQNDPTFKAIFSYGIMVRDLLDWFVGELLGARELVDALDLERLRRGTEQSVAEPPDALHRSASDQVWRVPFRADGVDPNRNAWRSLTVMLEYQRRPDRAMALRTQYYAAVHWMDRLRTRDGRMKEGEMLPPVLPLVIYSGRRAWRSPTRLMDLITPPATAAAPDLRDRSSSAFAAHEFPALDIHRLRREDFRDDNAVSLLASLTNPDPERAAAQATALVLRLAGDELRELRALARPAGRVGSSLRELLASGLAAARSYG
jgi:hypothetical protein